jgi:hypothetical protein
MNATIPILIIGAILAVGIPAALVMLLIAIRLDERRMNLNDESRTSRRTVVRRMLGFYASQPEEVSDVREDVRR